MLNWEQVKITINNVFSYLDTIDLLPYLKEFEGKDVYDLMDKLEEKFPFKDQYSETLFDTISVNEFTDYLNKRYNLKIQETTVSYYYIRL